MLAAMKSNGGYTMIKQRYNDEDDDDDLFDENGVLKDGRALRVQHDHDGQHDPPAARDRVGR